ncbi:MAG TPA: T9SS type A sorting domain-containing protein [Bacteroidota bacterium]
MKPRTLNYSAMFLLMVTRLFFVSSHARAQTECHYIPSTSLSTDTLSYSFSGGTFESYGCAPIDPTYWLAGYGMSVTVTFVNPEQYPSFRVWGMNDDDTASVSVHGVSYPLTSSSASYDPKVVCGVSPGPNGIFFSGGNIVGANSNSQSNYSYQDIQLHTIDVTSFTVTGISGDGWGFAGVLVDCPLQGLIITSPKAGELWIAGEQDTIRWSAPPGLQLRIEFSDDDGATYSTVATNIQSDSNHYVWDIPPALSRKCRIKLIDIADESTYAVSERFKVKGYQLTRLRTDSSYEAFLPDLHGWRFLNTADTMWPGSWWSQFNYQSGLDPYTNELYPDDNPFASAFSDDFVDWPLFVKSFLPSRCYLSLTPPVYSPSAAFQWGETTIPYGGSCDGFAISSLLAFDFEQAFLDSFPSIGTYVNLYDLPVNDERRKVINQLWEYQFGVEHLNYVLPRQTGTRPRETLAELKTMLLADSGDHRYLRAIDQGVPRVHALVPYRLEKDGFSPGVHNVFVYDCNLPGVTSTFVAIDSSTDSWEYAISGYSGNKGLFLMDPVSGFLPHPTLGTSPLAVYNLGDSLLRVFITSAASIVITNSTGETIGFGDSTVTSTFAEGIPILPPTSRYQPPIGYYIPMERYSIDLSDMTDSLVRLSFFSDSIIYGYHRRDALSTQTDRLAYETNGISLRNTDTQPKLGEFKTIIREGNTEKAIEIGGYINDQNDSSFFGAINHDHLKLVNAGSQKQFSLRLLNAAAAGQSRFLHIGLDIPSNSSEEIVPTWTNLGLPVTIYIDLGNNGTIDDTVFIGNTLDVDEQGLPEIPKEYSLAQNYPNPFNPVTRIEYEVPHASRVRLTVYNVLGQLVTTLVDEERPAGRFAAEWTGNNVSSGVYFCRLEARQNSGQFLFSRVKKMVLMK